MPAGIINGLLEGKTIFKNMPIQAFFKKKA